MAAALAAAASRDYETCEATDIGLQNWFLAAAALSAWDYALLLTALSIIFVYYVLDFHIVGDILRGWKGDAIGLYYDRKSQVSARLVAKCETLKQRFWPTPWLCSPHLQTLFLHFVGRSPAVEYQRQLFITSDGGTIALDWVKVHTFSEDGSGENKSKNPALDETPTAIILPGLTSDSSNHYLKHVARSFSDNGWRVLVANHRGLGGVSITSDQFYNAGWTEDLRKVILLVQRTYPKSPLLAVGTSIGANILVKYLGEEGPRTPLGGAVAICCPWDLLILVKNRCAKDLQQGIGLWSAAICAAVSIALELHQTAFSRMVDWSLLQKSASIRDFDNYCTRHVGKYETVDTYYRRCSSVQFLESIAVPLLCISAEDDPICTKEAIPYDECRINPNVILGVTRHGGHLAYYEGFDASSVWWVRAATEFARVLLSSSLMHSQSNINDAPSTKFESNIDKGPFVTMTEGLQVTAQDSGYDGDFITVSQENHNREIFRREIGLTVDEGSNVTLDKPVTLEPNLTADGRIGVVADGHGGPFETPDIQKFQTETSIDNDIEEAPNDTRGRPISTDVQLEGSTVTLQLRSPSEVAALRSALSQLLDQVPLPSSIMEEASRNGFKPSPNSPDTASYQSQSIEVPITGSLVADFGNCVEATKDLLVDNDTKVKRSAVSADVHHPNHRSPLKEQASAHLNLTRDFTGLRSQNRRTLWLLTYVALVTTFPILGSALLVRTRGKILDVLNRRWLKRTR